MRRALVLMPALALAILAGCSARIGGSRGLDEVADELRAENAELRAKLEAAEAEREELKAKLAAASGTPEGAEIAAATPHLAVVEIDELSGATAKGWKVYVRTLDGRQRFLQVVGTLEVTVEEEGGAVLGRRRLSPVELREAYRSSFSGTHYTVEVEGGAGGAGKSVTIGAVLTDGAGRTYAGSRKVGGSQSSNNAEPSRRSATQRVGGRRSPRSSSRCSCG